MEYKNLFEKIEIGNIEIKNRFVMPAMESSTTKDNKFTEQSVSYFGARAKGGFGLIITDYCAVSPEGIGVKNEVGLWTDECIDNLKMVTDEIHKYGAKAFCQLHHSGMMCVQKTTGYPTKGPSAIASPNYLEKVTALTKEEIEILIHQYAQAALRAKKGGYDGVEVHGAHGYQIAQFLSKFANKRSDEYGGSYKNRFRFAKRIIEEIKKLCGEEYPMLFRISADEFIESGCTLEDAIIYAKMAEKAGIHAIHVSTGTGIGGNIVTPQYFSPGFNLKNAEQIKKEVSIPVIAVGRINEPTVASFAIENKQTDMVSLGRQSICDPEFPIKLKEGREDEIFHCTGCMQRCYYTKGCADDDTGVSCMLNPFSGKEHRWTIQESENQKKIAIIGAGPAGLEAAWILAKRGHNVQVYEKQNIMGGNYRIAAIPPKKQDLAYNLYVYETLGRKYGVQYHLNQEVTKEMISNLQCDVIILATGSKPLMPPIPGIQNENVIGANAVLEGKEIVSKENVLILGGGLVGCETAEFLHMYGNQVTIVDMADAVAKESAKRPRAALLERLNQENVKIVLNTKIDEIVLDGIVGTNNTGKVQLDGFTKIVLALGYRNYNPLEEVAKSVCDEVYVIGDAKRARDAKMAIYEGAVIGKDI